MTTLINLQHSSSLQQQIEVRCTASKLGRAAGSQSIETLQQALQGWTAEEMDAIEGKNPLHMAAWQGCIENVQYLVQHVGCNVNAISKAEFSYGKTAIFFAETRCRNDVVLYLLEQGAHVTIVNNKGQSVRSIASSHLLPHVVERICQHEHEQPWTNYRMTHSDHLEYGDLDPRFLDRPLRDTDVVTEHAVNPTTKQSRQGSFLRKNPHLRTTADDTKKTKKENTRTRRRNNVLSTEETHQLDRAWTRVLETMEVVLVENPYCSCLSSSKTDILTIVQLSDKQHGAWIPEAAQRFQTTCTNRIHVVTEYLTFLSGDSSHKRERILLQKLVAEMLGTRGSESSSSVNIMNSSTDNSRHSHSSSSIQTSHALLRDRREELEVILANESIARFQQPSPDGLDVLHLPEPAYWVDSVSEELTWLEEAMMECNVAAIDTEWCNHLEDGSIDVATLQIAIPGRNRPWILDLLSDSEEFQERTKQLVNKVLFDSSRIVLGFAMGNDLPKLEMWLCSELPRNSCLDVQMLHISGDQLKGLASIVQLYSDLPLSKTEQCSSWSDRPLSRAQMEYAGLDAAILPVLVAEWLNRTR